MVGPTWMSLIWTIVKPSSARGRSSIGTSIVTTARAAPRVEQADRRRQQRKQRYRRSGVGAPAVSGMVCGQIASTVSSDASSQIAREGQHQQRREEAHRQQADPREPVAERLALDGARQHAERNQQARQHEPQCCQPPAGGVDRQVRDDPEADVNMQQDANANKANKKR